jgi:hypothetical protein
MEFERRREEEESEATRREACDLVFGDNAAQDDEPE